MEKDVKGKELVETRVGPGILVSGRIEGEGNVLVEGRVDGEVNIKGDLHIDVSGQVKADVRARNVYVRGILVGNAEGLEKVEIADGGRMLGDARSPRMLINEGALFSGMVDMVDFESGEDRTSETRSAQRRQALRTAPPAPTPRPPRPAPRPSAPAPQSYSAPRPAPTPRGDGNGSEAGAKPLYAAPPLPKPADVAGVRKAIIIKKKSTAEGG